MIHRSIEDARNFHAWRKFAIANKDAESLDIPELPAFIEEYRKQKHPILLDLGCGVGLYSVIWHQAGYIVYGIDQIHEAIIIAKQKYPDIVFQVMNANTPIFINDFDVVFTHTVLQHVHDIDKPLILQNVHQSLKPGGLFLIWEDFLPDERDASELYFGEGQTCLFQKFPYSHTVSRWITLISEHKFQFLKKTEKWLLFQKIE